MTFRVQLCLFFFLGILLFPSCTMPNPEAEVQAQIAEPEFVEILTEIHIIEATYRMSEIKRDSFLQYSAEEMFQIVYEKHNTTRAHFLQTLDYYSFYPEKLQGIYKQVEEKIAKLE